MREGLGGTGGWRGLGVYEEGGLGGIGGVEGV